MIFIYITLHHSGQTGWERVCFEFFFFKDDVVLFSLLLRYPWVIYVTQRIHNRSYFVTLFSNKYRRSIFFAQILGNLYSFIGILVYEWGIILVSSHPSNCKTNCNLELSRESCYFKWDLIYLPRQSGLNIPTSSITTFHFTWRELYCKLV